MKSMLRFCPDFHITSHDGHVPCSTHFMSEKILGQVTSLISAEFGAKYFAIRNFRFPKFSIATSTAARVVFADCSALVLSAAVAKMNCSMAGCCGQCQVPPLLPQSTRSSPASLYSHRSRVLLNPIAFCIRLIHSCYSYRTIFS